MYFEYPFTIDSRDADYFGHCRPSALLGLLQEAGSEAAAQLGASRRVIEEKYSAFWMLARLWYRLDRPLAWGEQLTVRTWHREKKGASMYRDFDLLVDGRVVGEAVTVWVLADLHTHKPLRISALEEFRGTGGGDLCKAHQLTRLRMPEGMVHAGSRRLWYSDADLNRHVNNSRYADFACDALDLERLGEGRFVSSLQLGFLAECHPGETLELLTGASGEQYFVHGTDAAGTARFDAALTLTEIGRNQDLTSQV